MDTSVQRFIATASVLLSVVTNTGMEKEWFWVPETHAQAFEDVGRKPTFHIHLLTKIFQPNCLPAYFCFSFPPCPRYTPGPCLPPMTIYLPSKKKVKASRILPYRSCIESASTSRSGSPRRTRLQSKLKKRRKEHSV